MVASGGGLFEGYGHDGPGVCLGDGQTEAYLKDMGMTGLASAWAMARRRPKEYRHNVDAATRSSGVCPFVMNSFFGYCYLLTLSGIQ